MKTKKADGGRLGLPLAAAFFRLAAPPPALSLQQPPHKKRYQEHRAGVQPSKGNGKPSFQS
jgi:hypothetical protein